MADGFAHAREHSSVHIKTITIDYSCNSTHTLALVTSDLVATPSHHGHLLRQLCLLAAVFAPLLQ